MKNEMMTCGGGGWYGAHARILLTCDGTLKELSEMGLVLGGALQGYGMERRLALLRSLRRLAG